MVTVPRGPGRVSAGPALGRPVTAGQAAAQEPVQVGAPPLVSFPYVYTTVPSALASTQPRLDRCTIRTCVPGEGRPTAADGWPAAFGVELELADDDDEDDEDPPQAVSSSASIPSPAATAQPLLRITSLQSTVATGLTRSDTPETYQTAGPPGGYLAAT